MLVKVIAVLMIISPSVARLYYVPWPWKWGVIAFVWLLSVILVLPLLPGNQRPTSRSLI